MMIPNMGSGKFIFPKCPQELCFNDDDFIKDSFSVDQFLQDHRRRANLEVMRDDLGVYLKILRSAMIELINKDYTEFISLSTNLIDLDKRLDNIQSPVSQLSNHIVETCQQLHKNIEEMDFYIKKKKELKLQKQVLANIKHIDHSMMTLNHLQNCQDETVLSDRILSEISFIQYHIKSCQGKPEFTKISTNWESLNKSLLFKIQTLLLRAYNNQENSKVSCYITVLVNLTCVSDVEKFINEEILPPLLDTLISENSLASDPRSLEGLYARLLTLVDSFNSMFDPIENESFDFLVHCLVPEILKRLSLNLKSIFAPGNADMFHRRYKESSLFLNALEDRCRDQDSVKQLQECEQFKQYNNSWNMSVYFQLRFQAIAGKLEISLESQHVLSGNRESNGYKLSITGEAWECIQMCWSPQVFLPPIIRHLWKLTLQIISRYCTFCDEAIRNDWPIRADDKMGKTSFLVHLNSDLLWFKNQLASLVDMISFKIKPLEEKKASMVKSLAESESILADKIKFTKEKIVEQVSKESLVHIRSVNDIPRHFRRTNREMPLQASAYVSSLMAPPLKFMNDFPAHKVWLLEIFNRITLEYYNSVREVITSVQRTEESLRRFKKIREKSGGDSSKSGGVGDEEKIKQQISLDVQHYQSIVQKAGLELIDVNSLSDLIEMVEQSLAKQAED